MNKKRTPLPAEEKALFRHATQDVKKLPQDTLRHRLGRPSLLQQQQRQQQRQEQVHHHFYFSDEYQPLLQTEGPTRFLREGVDRYQLKRLRRGDYIPELFLDLHGLTQQQAKQELAALIAACLKEHIYCACVMHGYGKHILKQQVPLWLAQHPDIIAFHQAPKTWGGDAALLLLVEIPALQS
ncbi:MAG: endonuclease SmrB [Enterobacteriaceae bacterium]